jgi:hypothetical protein
MRPRPARSLRGRGHLSRDEPSPVGTLVSGPTVPSREHLPTLRKAAVSYALWIRRSPSPVDSFARFARLISGQVSRPNLNCTAPDERPPDYSSGDHVASRLPSTRATLRDQAVVIAGCGLAPIDIRGRP